MKTPTKKEALEMLNEIEEALLSVECSWRTNKALVNIPRLCDFIGVDEEKKMNAISKKFKGYIKMADKSMSWGNDERAKLYATLALAMASTGLVEEDVFDEEPQQERKR